MPRHDLTDQRLTDELIQYELLGGSAARLPSRPRVAATGLAAIVAIVALAVGVPYLLQRFVGNPLPASIPTWSEFTWSVTNGEVSDRFWIGLLAIIAWFAWAQLMAALTFEILGVVRSANMPTLPTFGLAQGVAAQLVGAVLMLSVVLSSVPVDASALGLAHDVQRPSIDTTQIIDAEPDLREADESMAVVQVQRRQTLRSLAQDHYGDGDRWVEIRDRNVGATMSDGAVLPVGFTRVKAGWSLEIPDSNVAFRVGTWTVAPGDHFWGIAKTTLSEAYGRVPADDEIRPYWLEIIEINDERIRSGSPDIIFPGDTFDLTLPPVPGEIAGSADRLATTTPFPITSAQRLVSSHEADVAAVTASEAAAAAESLSPATEDVASNDKSVDGQESKTTPGGEDESDESDDSDESEKAEGAATGIGAADTPDPSEHAPVVVPPGGGGAGSGGAGSGGALGSVPVSAARESTRSESAPPTNTPAASPPADGASPVVRVIAGVSGLGFLAAGFVRALRRRREAQWARRVEGRAPAQPASGATLLRNDLAATGSADRADFVDTTLRALWATLAPETRPAVTHLDVSDESVLIRSTGNYAELPKCVSLGDGSGWEITRRRSVDLVAGVDGVATAALPLLLSVGCDGESGQDLVINLGQALTVDLRGPLEARRRFLCSAALELATSRFADDLTVICCGFGGEIEGLRRIEAVGSPAEAIELVRSDPFSVIDVTAAPSETTSDFVVLIEGDASADDLDSLAQLALSGVAVIAPGIASQWCVELSPGHLEVRPINRVVERVDLTADQFSVLGELVATSALTEYVTPDLLVEDSLGGETALETEVFGVPMACDLEIRVLGRVEVVGADRDFESARALDVVTYLAFYRDGADADQLRTWIWPVDEPPTDKAFANVMTRARKGLGVDDDGEPYLSRAGSDGVYRLSKAAATDFDRFQGHVEYASQLGDPEALEQLVEGLQLVRGVPFTGGGATGFLWTDLGVRSHIEYAIDEAAHRCADTALALGDSSTARWAAFKGLTIIPGCEQCYRRRFLAASLDKNRSELTTAMAELQKLAGADLGEPEASDAISPELVELYEELMRNPAKAESGLASSPPKTT